MSFEDQDKIKGRPRDPKITSTVKRFLESSPEVMETLKNIKRQNEARKTSLKTIHTLNEFEREIGLPNIDSERFVTDTEINISKVDRALKKRGL